MAKITSINYAKLFPLGAFINEKIGVECQLDDGEDVMNVLTEAKKIVTTFHYESNKELYEMKGMKVTDIQEGEPVVQLSNPKLDQVQSIIRDMGTCTELKTLEAYRLIAKNNTDIQAAYDNQLKTLNNGL